MTFDTEAASTAMTVRPMPISTAPGGAAAALISLRKRRMTPPMATAEPIRNRRVRGCLRKTQESALFGTSSSANTTATTPEVM
jgi:hypothetical protein